MGRYKWGYNYGNYNCNPSFGGRTAPLITTSHAPPSMALRLAKTARHRPEKDRLPSTPLVKHYFKHNLLGLLLYCGNPTITEKVKIFWARILSP